MGKEAGMEAGIKVGTEMSLELASILIDQNRVSDLKRAKDDPAFYQHLIHEFQLKKEELP